MANLFIFMVTEPDTPLSNAHFVGSLIFMNKARRNELKQLKYKKRLKLIGRCTAETLSNPIGERYNFTGYKNSSQPCSCYACSPQKYNRAKVKRGMTDKEIYGMQVMEI